MLRTLIANSILLVISATPQTIAPAAAAATTPPTTPTDIQFSRDAMKWVSSYIRQAVYTRYNVWLRYPRSNPSNLLLRTIDRRCADGWMEQNSTVRQQIRDESRVLLSDGL